MLFCGTSRPSQNVPGEVLCLLCVWYVFGVCLVCYVFGALVCLVCVTWLCVCCVFGMCLLCVWYVFFVCYVCVMCFICSVLLNRWDELLAPG